jgi:hypothetical protein
MENYMSKRKIAGCVNVRIRTGDFQHIEVVKYAEEEIEYTSVEELKSKEDSLHDDLVDCCLRGLKSTAEKLGKGKAEAIEVEEKLSKAIPAWLANEPVPNIANGAKKVLNTVADKLKAEKDKAAETEKAILGEESTLTPTNSEKKEKFTQYVKDANTAIDIKDAKDAKDAKDTSGLSDLFEEDEKPKETPVEPVESIEVAVELAEEKKSDKSAKTDGDGFDIFSDDDIFGDK